MTQENENQGERPIEVVDGVAFDAVTKMPICTKPWPTAEQLREIAKSEDPEETPRVRGFTIYPSDMPSRWW